MLYFFVFIDIALAINLIAYVKAAQTGHLSAKLVKATFPLVIVLLFMLPALPQPMFELSSDSKVVVIVSSLILTILGIVVGILGFQQLNRNKTPVMPENWVPSKIVTSGIYGKIRHPLYLSAALIYTGFYLLFMGTYSLVFILPMIYLITYVRAVAEEKYILEDFNGYKEYQKSTGMFFPR